MAKIIFLVFILFVRFFILSQNHISFKNHLNEASYWFYETNYDSAQVYFEAAEKFKLPFYPEELHLFSRNLWELGDQKKSIEVLLNGGFNDFFINDTTFYIGLTIEERKQIASKLKSVDKDLITHRMPFYDSLYKLDQIYRRIIGSYGQNTIEFDSILDLMRIQDSLNFMALIREIKINGYPGGHKLAPIGPGAILIHSSKELLLNHYYVLLNEIEAGRMNFRDFSLAIDRFFTEDNQQTIYNCYISFNEDEVKSPELIFLNRCLIGMSPYFQEYVPRVLNRGVTPPKSELYDYYKRSKQNFNCIRIK